MVLDGRCEYYHQVHPRLTIVLGFGLFILLSTDRLINSQYVQVHVCICISNYNSRTSPCYQHLQWMRSESVA